MGWSISPNSATINSSGVASIPKNTGETDITYTITYVDSDGCEGSTTYKMKACPPTPCNCTNLNATGITDIPYGGSSSPITIGTISMDSCMSNARASSTESWISSLSVSGNEVKAVIATNPDLERTGTVTITVDKTGGGTCNKTMEIKQLSEDCTDYGSITKFTIKNNTSLTHIFGYAEFNYTGTLYRIDLQDISIPSGGEKTISASISPYIPIGTRTITAASPDFQVDGFIKQGGNLLIRRVDDECDYYSCYIEWGEG